MTTIVDFEVMMANTLNGELWDVHMTGFSP